MIIDSLKNIFGFKRNKIATILSRHHCYFISKLIQKELVKKNISSTIRDKKPKFGFKKHIHFVICPQIFEILPSNHISFQMEQAVAERWFTPKYFSILAKAKYILDYSQFNISFLIEKGINANLINFIPVYYYKNYFPQAENIQEEYDVAFYGDADTPRRQSFLNVISSKFNVKIITNCYGETLYNELCKAKVIINIHYYENALLETTRIYECLSLNKLVISETAADINLHQNLLEIVDFTEIGNINEMVEKIGYWVSNDEKRKNRVIQNTNKLENDDDIFAINFNAFLVNNNITF